MKEKKISVNIIYNVLNQIVSLLVPLILAPYVARVLSPELIGDYSYALANSSYFVLVEALGFPLYGMLKVSSNRDDKEYISALFREIMMAKTILMLVCVTIYIIPFVFFAGSNRILSAIMILNIISTGVDSTWFLSGMEDFKTTTLRNMVVRLVNVVLIVILVKSEKDFLRYALIMQMSNVISYAVVFPTVKKYTIPVRISFKRMIEHTKKSMIYFIPGIINTIFTSADKTILGAFANNYEVGVYEQACKISTLCGTVINSISNVVLPRVTYLNHNATSDEAKKFLFKTLRYASVLSVAVTAGIFCISDEFIPVFFGQEYEKSSILLKILSINVLMSVLANFIGQQCLVSKSKQKEYNIAISIGAALNVLTNILVVNKLQSVGVSIASVVSSATVFGIVLAFSKDRISFRDVIEMNWRAIIAATFMILIIYKINTNSLFITCVVKVLIGTLIYLAVLVVLKEDVIQQIKNVNAKNINGL